MSVNITEITSSHKLTWEYGDYSGTIKLPGEPGPIDIEWDTSGDLPDNYEDMEDGIRTAAFDATAVKDAPEPSNTLKPYPLKARYKDRHPCPGVLTVLSIDWDARRLYLGGSGYIYFPDFDEIELVPTPVELVNTELLEALQSMIDITTPGPGGYEGMVELSSRLEYYDRLKKVRDKAAAVLLAAKK